MNEYNKTEIDTDTENKLVVTRRERLRGRELRGTNFWEKIGYKVYCATQCFVITVNGV